MLINYIHLIIQLCYDCCILIELSPYDQHTSPFLSQSINTARVYSYQTPVGFKPERLRFSLTSLMNKCPLAAGKEFRYADKTVFCSRHFSIRSLIFCHVNGGRRFLRNVYGPLPRCMALDHNSILFINSNSKT